MRQILSFTTIVLLLVLSACDKPANHAMNWEVVDGDTVYVCDLKQVSAEVRTLKLSELIDSFRIVRFEDNDSALFKTWKVYITDHYIGILQDASLPFKLFDHQGHFLFDVGRVGQGPGEYSALYSADINEKMNAIWLAPFNGNRLLQYNLQGKCTATVHTLPMRKPSFRIEADGTLTLTNLFFKRMGFHYLRYLGNDSIRYSLSEKYRAISPLDKDGNFVGFNHELWFGNNSEAFTYMTTASDTLMVYDREKDRSQPRLYCTSPKPAKGYYVFDELSSFFLIKVRTQEGLQQFLADKETGEVNRLELVNDFMGNLPISNFSPCKGWVYQMFEPIELIELIEEHLKKGDVSAKNRKLLQDYLSQIDENSNNILFMGKLL